MVERIKASQPPATWINIFGNDPTENGFDKFAKLPQVTAVLEQLQPIDQCFNFETRFTRHIHFISLKFPSKQQSNLARKRIIEEHKGLAWPPFAVIYASARFVLHENE